MGHSITGGHKSRDLVPLVGRWVEGRRSCCVKIIAAKPNEVKTGYSVVWSCKEGYRSNTSVLLVMVMIMMMLMAMMMIKVLFGIRLEISCILFTNY